MSSHYTRKTILSSDRLKFSILSSHSQVKGLHLNLKLYRRRLGFPIVILFRAIARNCAQLCGIGRNCSQIACNCADLRGIARSLQGSQLRTSKINLLWKPLQRHVTMILQYHWWGFWSCDTDGVT